MDAQAFAYWLHGWSEINGSGPPTATQWQIINDHLDLVFNKVTPNRYPVMGTYSNDLMRSGCGIASFTGHPPISDAVPVSGYPGLIYMPSPSPLFIC